MRAIVQGDILCHHVRANMASDRSFYKVIGVMATYPARVGNLESQLRRLSSQVDHLNVVLNEFSETPEFFRNFHNVSAIIPSHDYKDVGKFTVYVRDRNDLVFLFDDDLLYPPDYVQRTAAWIEQHEGAIWPSAVFGYHGTIYTSYIMGFWGGIINSGGLRGAFRTIRAILRNRRFPDKVVYCYWGGLKKACRVDQLGTGTVAMRAHLMPELKDMESAKKMVDVRLAKICQRHRIPMICIPRAKEWIPREDLFSDGIWSSFTANSPDCLNIEVRELRAGKRLTRH